MKRAAWIGTIGVVLVLAAAAYAATITCDGGRCEGTNEPDQITGSKQPDVIYARGASDRVEAEAGHDWVAGEEGVDFLRGGTGSDTLHGNKRADFLRGGRGDDHLYGDNDPLAGRPGIEIILDFEERDSDVAYGGIGDEEIHVDDDDGNDYVNCGPDGGEAFTDRGDVVENCDR
jgi:Ca2+-binding RTX toxin-like protein